MSIIGQNPCCSNRQNESVTSSKSNKKVTINGRFKVFPFGTLIKESEMYISCNDSSKYQLLTHDKEGVFSLQAELNSITNIKMYFSNPNNRRREPYYPIEIKNISIKSDSLSLGIIPLIVDKYGYSEEWGKYDTKKHARKNKNYFNIIVNDIENRLKVENKLNEIYLTNCKECNPIFITDVITNESETTISSLEKRKFAIDFQELNLISNYLHSNEQKTKL